MESHTFGDFEAFTDSVRDVNKRMTLHNPQRRTWRIDHVEVAGIHVQLGQLGGGNITEGRVDTDKYLLYAPLTDDCEHAMNGNLIAGHAFAFMEPGAEFCCAIPSEHAFFTVGVPLEMLACGEAPPSWIQPERATCGATPQNAERATRLRQAVGHLMTAARTCPAFESSGAAGHAAAELLEATASIIGGPRADALVEEGRPRVSRADIIRRCRELLEERGDERVSIADLTAAAHVSERTLRTAFHEYFGVAPARYLQLQRLHQVRRALRAADPDAESVADVLIAHGEWEFGRFASRYRRVFGELPSETLRG